LAEPGRIVFPEAAGDGGFDGGRRRADILAHVTESLQDFLTFESELLGEFVDAGLGHKSPSGLDTRLDRLVGGGIHRLVLIAAT
jgi:hypothetical protein